MALQDGHYSVHLTAEGTGLEKLTDQCDSPITEKWGTQVGAQICLDTKPVLCTVEMLRGVERRHTWGDVAQMVALGTGDLRLEAKKALEGLVWSGGLPRGGDP